MSECRHFTRRQWLAGSALTAGAIPLGRAEPPAPSAPAAPVSIAKCPSYDQDLVAALSTMFDQLGGMTGLVRGKTVSIKLNLTGSPKTRFPGHLPGATHWIHPAVAGACCHLLGKAGAKRIRLVESCGGRIVPLEDYLLDAGWDVKALSSAAPLVEFENTANLGTGKHYSRLKVSTRPCIYPAFDLNHCYEDSDVFVSLSKLKNHEECGITLTLKNSFGITPNSIYGGSAGVDEPNEAPRAGRDSILHYGLRQPPKSAPQEIDFQSNRYEGYRVPRILVDLAGARPIDLAIIDGITSCVGGEGPWVPGSKFVSPGVLVAGRNPVSTDAVATAVMGYDPRAKRGEGAFHVYKEKGQKSGDGRQWADNVMLLAEAVGIGSADLERIEVRGVSILDALYDFEARWRGQART
jgi:uncharacterized protein (DUF362 family)